MSRWMFSACFLALAAAPVAAADVRLGSYRKADSEGMRNAYHVYLDGVKAGFLSYNLWLRSHGGQQAFCMPDDLALSTEQAEEIMLRSADRRASKDNMLVALLLLSGLKDTYPCEKTGGSGTSTPPVTSR